MLRIDFDDITHFTFNEVLATGANIVGVQFQTIKRLDELRELWGGGIGLCFNGLNSGKHDSLGHKKGLAVDVYTLKKLTDTEATKFILMAASVGFTILGVYKGDSGKYSFHLEIGTKFRTWYANKVNGEWKYKGLEVK